MQDMHLCINAILLGIYLHSYLYILVEVMHTCHACNGDEMLKCKRPAYFKVEHLHKFGQKQLNSRAKLLQMTHPAPKHASKHMLSIHSKYLGIVSKQTNKHT